MRKERKVNIIRSLKSELLFYKQKTIAPLKVDITPLKHLRIQQAFSREEVIQMPKDIVSPLLIRRMVKAFEDSITELPIETEYDEDLGVYKAKLDLWVKPKVMYDFTAESEGEII